jgi:hypothetical protein
VTAVEVWTVVDYTACEGGNVIGVADSLAGGKGIAERDYERGPLEWVDEPAVWGGWTADQPGSANFYIVQRWTVESSPDLSESTP